MSPLQETRPLFLFAPGAGAGIDSAWMKLWRERLATLGMVEAFDYPYRLAGRKSPDRTPVLIAAHRAAWQAALTKHGGHNGNDANDANDANRPVFFIGKSMGSRMGCHLAVEEPSACRGLICLGYPLRGQNGKLRDEVLRALKRPVLFLQGTRDPLCPLAELQALLAELPVPHELLIVEGGNHSLEVPHPRQKKGEPRRDLQGESDARVLSAIATFVARVG
jgi:predicted alpha/beta-hydrolase family hydrolase